MKNLCFSGGGMKGIAYVGVYKYIIENNLNPENLSGTSIGAIFCLFIILKYSIEEVETLAFNLTGNILSDINLKYMFTDSYSIDSGKRIDYIIKKIISSKGYSKDITFLELYDKTGIGLHVCSTMLNDYSRKIFNHVNTPDVKVRMACKYSITIPFLWSSGKLNGSVYLDGCLSTNLPIEDFPTEGTIGITFRSKNIYSNIRSIEGYFTKIVKCLLRRSNSLEMKTYENGGYDILYIDIPPIDNLDFNMTIEKKKQIIDIGYTAMADNLKK